jgi:transcriptional regulator with XRE-family HTH domain
LTPDELRERRSELGLSQRRLAALLGVPASTVWRWESARMRIGHSVLLAARLEQIGREQHRRARRKAS